MQTPIVLFYLQKRIFGVDATQVVEMVKAPQITHVPNMPPHVLGIINLRNHTIPIVDRSSCHRCDDGVGE